LEVGGRPVFVSYWHIDLVGIVFYSGSRYVHIDYPRQDFEYLAQKEWPIHPYWDGWYEALKTPDIYEFVWVFVSEPTKASTPTGLSWTTQGLTDEAENVRFDCTEINCDARRPCSNGGVCSEGKCSCRKCYGGFECDVSPVSDYAKDQYMEWKTYVEQGGIPKFTYTRGKPGFNYWDLFWKGNEGCIEDLPESRR
jgi:hypothetical protein